MKSLLHAPKHITEKCMGRIHFSTAHKSPNLSNSPFPCLQASQPPLPPPIPSLFKAKNLKEYFHYYKKQIYSVLYSNTQRPEWDRDPLHSVLYKLLKLLPTKGFRNMLREHKTEVWEWTKTNTKCLCGPGRIAMRIMGSPATTCTKAEPQRLFTVVK